MSFNLLYPLDLFYADARRHLPQVEQVRPDQIPEPYRRLLVPDHDMTPTLEAFHGDRIHLRVLDRRVTPDALCRLVDLVLNGMERPVEFGAIVIYFDTLPDSAREVLLEGYRPLGTILADLRVPHSSHPQAFIRVVPDPFIRDSLSLAADAPLYGRRNHLLTAEGKILADIVEILPPVPESR